jgi:phytoene dehydrogenase-like protein
MTVDEVAIVRSLASATPLPSALALDRVRKELAAAAGQPRHSGELGVVGGGLGGLVAAIIGVEAGLRVTVHEAKATLGGRAHSTDGPYVANWGPHALYADGSLWAWLEERDLLPEVVEPALEAGVVFRVSGTIVDFPVALFDAAHVLSQHVAPTDRAFGDWAEEIVGSDLARAVAGLAGVFSFHHDPAQLSAEFVLDRLSRVTSWPPSARFVVGGWRRLIDGLRGHAHALGVRFTLGTRVDTLPEPPVILAIPLRAASKLLGVEPPPPPATRTALLDLGLTAEPGDPYAIWDSDEAGWAETYTHRDPSLAPPGEHLVQAQLGMRPGETSAQAERRLEALLDVGYRGWRDRVTWRRRAVVSGESGALDLPGTSWIERPQVDRGAGVYVVGDAVAAPGLLSEVVQQAAARAVNGVLAHVA